MNTNIRRVLLTASALVAVGGVNAVTQAADLIVLPAGATLNGDAGLYDDGDSIVFSVNNTSDPAVLTLQNGDYQFLNVTATAGGAAGGVVKVEGDGSAAWLKVHGDVLDVSSPGTQNGRITFVLDGVGNTADLSFVGGNSVIYADIESVFGGLHDIVRFEGNTLGASQVLHGNLGKSSSRILDVLSSGDGITKILGETYAQQIRVLGDYQEDINGNMLAGAMLFGGNVDLSGNLLLAATNGSAVGFGYINAELDERIDVYANITTLFADKGKVFVMGGDHTTNTDVIFRGSIGTALRSVEAIEIANNTRAGFLGTVYANSLRFVGQNPNIAEGELGVVQLADGVDVNADFVVVGNAHGHIDFQQNSNVFGVLQVSGSQNAQNRGRLDLNLMGNLGSDARVIMNGNSDDFVLEGHLGVDGIDSAALELLTGGNIYIDGIAQISLERGYMLLGGLNNFIGSKYNNTDIDLQNGRIVLGGVLELGGVGVDNVNLTAAAKANNGDMLIDAGGHLVNVMSSSVVNLNITGAQNGQEIIVIGDAAGASDLKGQLDAGKFKFIDTALLKHNTSKTDASNLISSLTLLNPDDVLLGVNSGIGVGAAQSLAGMTNATGDLAILRDRLLNAATASDVQRIAESASPTVNGASVMSAIQTVKQMMGTLQTRMTGLREGISSGDAVADKNAWVQVFGQSGTQKRRQNIDGFDANTYGLSVGMDTDRLVDGATVGIAFSYANSDVKSKNVNRTKTDIDSYQLSVYGNYDLSHGAYVTGAAGVAINRADQTRHDVGGIAGANATSNPHSQQYSAFVEGGKTFGIGHGLELTPNASAHYQHLNADGYTERGFAALRVNGFKRDLLELGVGARLSMVHETANGGRFVPALEFGYRYDVINDDIATTSAFTGGGASFGTPGLKPAPGTFNIGLGFKYDVGNNWSIDAGYDFETKSQYRAHAGVIRVGYKF